MYNPFSLQGKTVLVTGASSGIGKGIAVECSKMGAKVVVNGRNEERLAETLSLLEGEGHLSVNADLSTEEGIEKLVSELPEIQGCVMSAAIPQVKPIKFFKRRDIEDIFAVNTIAPMLLTSALLKKKKIKSGASIVYISAITGAFVGSAADTSYVATKGGLSGFMKGAAIELAAQGIRVNTINPGLVPTNILNVSNGLFAEEHHTQTFLDKYPLKRLGTPQDIAYGAVYLLSDASTWVTGTALVIDGGYVAQ